MSSYPQHEKNLQALQELGFDIEEYTEDPYESWGYDEQVYLISDIVSQLKKFEENADIKLKDGI